MTQPAASTGSHRSIATRLLRVSFEYYVVIAIILTALVVWGEYLSTTSALRREIANYQHVFEAPLANALWAMDTSKVSSISKGMVEIPDISAVRVSDLTTGHLYGIALKDSEGIEFGEDERMRQRWKELAQHSVVHHGFDIVYTHATGTAVLGRVEVLTGRTQLINRIRGQTTLIVAIALFKEAILWGIFLAVGRRLLVRPLTELIRVLNTMEPNDPGRITVPRSTEATIAGTELAVFRDSFNALIDQIQARRAELVELNNHLENQVVERTQALAESEQTLRTIIETEPECVKVLALDGTLVRMNQAGLAMIEAESDAQVIGTPMIDLVAPEHRPAFIALNEQVLQGASGVLEFEIIGLKGGRRWFETHAVPMRNSHGQINGLLAVTRDVTQRKTFERELVRLAQTDALTGLANRRHFMALAEQELSRAIRYGGELSVMMMDIDHFKAINDTYGHHTGDLVLQRVGMHCQEALREIDIVGRIGGEEFAFILPQTSKEKAGEVAERLRRMLANADLPLEHGVPLHFEVSIGVTAIGPNGGNIDTLLAQADTALYEAKRQGRNQIRVFGAAATASAQSEGIPTE